MKTPLLTTMESQQFYYIYSFQEAFIIITKIDKIPALAGIRLTCRHPHSESVL